MDSKNGERRLAKVLYLPTKLICQAIKGRRRLEFEYDGLFRVVEPYCHGTTTQGRESLRAIQVGGWSRSAIIAAGKLWTLAKMTNVKLTTDRFVPDDRHYQPEDSALPSLHCRI
jgi:hypothetical protein